MVRRILQSSIFLFALVFARANVFAQIFEVKSNNVELLHIDGLAQKLLEESVDSILNSAHLARGKVWVVFDTLTGPNRRRTSIDSGLADHNQAGSNGQYISKLMIEKFQSIRTIKNHSADFDEGVITVVGSGTLLDLTSRATPQSVSFSRSVGYQTSYDRDSGQTSSFWTSTAKPILVTLGAVAVVALFFFIRG